MLARPLARAMLASWFVARGVDAVRRPAAHVEESTPVLRAVAERVSGPLGHDLTTYLDGPTLRRAAQARHTPPKSARRPARPPALRRSHSPV